MWRKGGRYRYTYIYTHRHIGAGVIIFRWEQGWWIDMERHTLTTIFISSDGVCVGGDGCFFLDVYVYITYIHIYAYTSILDIHTIV